MGRKNIRTIAVILLLCIVALLAICAYKNKSAKLKPDEVIGKIETALGEDFKKQSMTELAATMVYGDKDDESNKVYLRILKTTYYEADPSVVTGLHTDAFNVLFNVESMDSCEKMKIKDWDAALYKKEETAYLCWTYSPEVSYALEYNPNLLPDSEVIKMAESAEMGD